MTKVRVIVRAALLIVVILSSTLLGDDYTIKWHVVSTGGTQSTYSDGKTLHGTVVQTAIGTVSSSNYRVYQGFWQEFTSCRAGDADGSGNANISDAVYIISFIFLGGPEPVTACGGDADGNGFVNVSDAIWLIRYIFQSP